MGVFAGPDLKEDGLVLCLDAGNTKSYVGSGTTWTDISGIPLITQIGGKVNEGGNLTLTAPPGGVITNINFASYGTPTGTYPNFSIGGCHATNSFNVVNGLAFGKTSVTIPATNSTFGDPCPGTAKALAVVATTTSPYISTFTNGPTYSSANGGSIVFDGGDDYSTSGALSGSFASFTVIIWFYPTSVTNYQNPIDCNYSYNGNTGNIGPRLEIYTGGQLLWIYSNDTAVNGNFYYQNVVNSNLSPNTWHCASITYNGGTNTSTTYYNGNSTGLSRTLSGTPTGFVGTMNNVNIGRGFHLGGAERPFAGRVSNVSIYNRALTAAEIRQNFNATKSRFGL